MEAHNKERAKIQAIYPLTNMQQGLLFHHLMSDLDQGFLQLQTKLEGKLNQLLLRKAWEATVKRHEILRTTIHWINVKKPIQVVRPHLDIDWNYYDWSTMEESSYIDVINKFKFKEEERITNFEKGPLARINVIRFSENLHYLIWNCHHILLDGWSSSILLNDIFLHYEGFVNNTVPNLDILPTTKSYFHWSQRQDKQEALGFWKKTLDKLEYSPIFSAGETPLKGKNRNECFTLSSQQTSDLNKLSKKYKITLNSLFQSVWGLLLGMLYGQQNVLFGTTVSGRNNSFPKMDLLAGMFANVLPVYLSIDIDSSAEKLFQNVQEQQQQARKYEHITIDEISSHINWSSGSQMFDSLFIFENYPWSMIEKGGIRVKNFESGITTTYPITFSVQVGNELQIHLISDINIISEAISDWFIESLKNLLPLLIDTPNIKLSKIYETIGFPEHLLKNLHKVGKKDKEVETSYFAAKNKLQLQLTEVWEIVFGKKNIGIYDNFFEIGGKSLMAVKIFSLLEQKFNIKLEPTSLLKHPTIASLSKFIQGDNIVETWKFIVPLRAKGIKKPLFCIHGGGGHVFFYNPLVSNLHKDRPVYALQPSGLDGRDQMHKSIEEMAISYVNEIKQVQLNGPYNLMVYCFSTAVGIEMARILAEMNETTNLIVADSILAQEDIMTLDRLKMRLTGFIKRLAQNPLKGIKLMVMTKTLSLIHI